MEQLKKAAENISNIFIQGATNIALYGIEHFIKFAKRHRDLEKEELFKKLKMAEDVLVSARDTEATLKNGLLYILGMLKRDMKNRPDEDIIKLIEKHGNEFNDMLKETKKKIAKFGSRLIPENDEKFTIMTHCHSSTVDEVLLRAADEGKKFRVVVTETRPLYQGRITSKVLAEHGIKVFNIVDSAMRWATSSIKVHSIITGANALSGDGTVLNKTGAKLMALVAKENHIPYYVATNLFKYNPSTVYGEGHKIEMRDPTELTRDWDEVPKKNFRAINPSFESIERVYINGLITELGIFPSSDIHEMFSHYYKDLCNMYEEIEHENTHFQNRPISWELR